jgi:hypothetical protein
LNFVFRIELTKSLSFMKKFIPNILLIAISLWIFPDMDANPFVQPVRSMEIPYSETVIIDCAPDANYSASQSTTAFIGIGSTGADADFTASFQACYNSQRLYILATVLDDYASEIPYTTGPSPWTWDNMVVCISLDTTNTTTSYDTNTIYLIFNRGIQDSATWPGRAGQDEYAGNVYSENTAEGWVLEVGIPWTAVLGEGQLPEDLESYLGAIHGFDVMFCDNDTDGPDARDCMSAWDEDDPGMPDATEDLAWNNRTVFGIMTLSSDGYHTLPVANAGPDQTVDENTSVTLDGTESYDPEAETISYTWSAPSPITLSDIHSDAPGFTTPDISINTSYTISLVVNDGTYNSLPDYVIINVTADNVAPIANAGPDQTVNENTVVTLDGTSSYDPEGETVSYTWAAPPAISLSDVHSENPNFTAPEISENTSYIISLVVSDGALNSTADQVTINVDQVVSTTESEENPDITLSPNPTNQFMDIKSGKLIYSIEIIDLSGEVIWQKTINAMETEISIGSFSASNYILRLNTEAGIVTKQFILE